MRVGRVPDTTGRQKEIVVGMVLAGPRMQVGRRMDVMHHANNHMKLDK